MIQEIKIQFILSYFEKITSPVPCFTNLYTFEFFILVKESPFSIIFLKSSFGKFTTNIFPLIVTLGVCLSP